MSLPKEHLKLKPYLTALLAAILLITNASNAKTPDTKSNVVTSNDVEWGYLNPLRGKLSPRAANLWGDRTKDTATGMLVGFNKGFRSPPHIHNITYRGIVIDGEVHNDDPLAEDMWLPKGSFWTQPAGEIHITAANGDTNLIYLEIDSGPYLVQPSKEAFDNGERPLNQHRDNIVWLSSNELTDVFSPEVEMTFLWQDAMARQGTMIKLPGNFKGNISTSAEEFRAVIISGNVIYSSNETSKVNLKAASYIESTGQFKHQFDNLSNHPVIIYVRSDTTFKID